MQMLVKVCCPLCKSVHSRHWASENGFTAVKCANCGFVYLNPRPPNECIDEKNKIGFHGTKSDTFRSLKILRTHKVHEFKRRITPILHDMGLTDKKIDWLDVGAGSGELLYALKTLLPTCTCAGIEPSRPKIATAIKYHINIADLTIDQINQKYDVISLINVFSHLPEPVEFILKLKSRLKQNGFLILVTGNGGDVPPLEYPDSFFFPDHLVFAGETHILRLLDDCGFSIISLKKYRYFIQESMMIRLLKSILGGHSLFNRGPFRSMWIVAQI